MDTGNNRVVVADQDFSCSGRISAFGDGDSFSSPMAFSSLPKATFTSRIRARGALCTSIPTEA